MTDSSRSGAGSPRGVFGVSSVSSSSRPTPSAAAAQAARRMRLQAAANRGGSQGSNSEGEDRRDKSRESRREQGSRGRKNAGGGGRRDGGHGNANRGDKGRNNGRNRNDAGGSGANTNDKGGSGAGTNDRGGTSTRNNQGTSRNSGNRANAREDRKRSHPRKSEQRDKAQQGGNRKKRNARTAAQRSASQRTPHQRSASQRSTSHRAATQRAARERLHGTQRRPNVSTQQVPAVASKDPLYDLHSNLPLSVETSAGGLVLSGLAEAVAPDGSVDLNRIYVALIGRLDRRGRLLWSMPKGHIESDEAAASTAEREVWEETGVSGAVIGHLGTIDYWFVSEGVRIHKTVHHHLLRFVDGELNDEDPEVTEVQWLPFPQIAERLAYADERRLARDAYKRLPDLARAEAQAGRVTPR